MGRPAGPIEKVVVDTYIIISQRRITCHKCGSLYIGAKLEVVCFGCKAVLKTVDAQANKKIPTGVWSVFKDKQISTSSIIGEVIADGDAAASSR